MRSWLLCACALLGPLASGAAQEPTPRTFTHADTLRGANTPQRAWWDVTFYDLHVAVHPADSTIAGYNGITYRVLRPAREMQIDLQVPLDVDSMVQDGRRLSFRRDGNAFFATLGTPQRAGDRRDDHRLLPRQAPRGGAPALGRRASSGPQDSLGRLGRDRRPKGWAPASGGPTRTTRPTSPTASAWRSRCPTR